MPDLAFHVRWPDGSVQRCSAQSPVVRDFLDARRPYALGDFLHRSRCAMHAARAARPEGTAVRELMSIETAAARFAADPTAQVVVEGFVGRGSAPRHPVQAGA